jgi:hypothetical protein
MSAKSSEPSWPDLFRPSTSFLGCLGKQGVDDRDKPGHDDVGRSRTLWVGITHWTLI